MVWAQFLGIVVGFLTTHWTLKERRDAERKNILPLPSGSDPPPLVDVSLLDEAVSCPVQVDEAKGVVLLVHGTGVTPEINWEYTLIPPLIERGFQPCYVAVPERLFLDGQRSAEFVSHAIHQLSARHPASGGVSIVSWSAGALVTQWTLTFYPEARAKVRQHIALGPSYRGSWTMVPLVYLNRYSEAVVQQLPWSGFLAALRRCRGVCAPVPTTSIGSSTDQIVQPGFLGQGGLGRFRDSWRLSGPRASNVDVFKVCARNALEKRRLPRLFTHQSLLWEAASHKVIFDALENQETRLGTADAIEAADCEARLAPGLKPEWGEKHEEILPELFKYAQSLKPQGWPEVPLRSYANDSSST